MQCFDRNQNCMFYYGWYHYMSEPEKNKVFLKEYVKGPYTNQLLMFSDPYLTDEQQGLRSGGPIEIKNGIPDPLAEYVISGFASCEKRGSKRKLYKEDINVSGEMRKRYRLYLGQGIPDPCTINPYISQPNFCDDTVLLQKEKICSTTIRPYLKSCKKKHCFCCEKKYLFECPDKWNENSREINCSCQNCHQMTAKEPPNVEYNETCTGTYNYDESSSLKGKGDNQSVTFKPSAVPEEFATMKSLADACTSTKPASPSDKNLQRELGQYNLTPKSSENKCRLCCCPYSRKSRNSKHEELLVKPIERISVTQTQPILISTLKGSHLMAHPSMKTATKEIQTEPLKYTAESQTEWKLNDLKKHTRKCECSKQCALCDESQCQHPDSICPKNFVTFVSKCTSKPPNPCPVTLAKTRQTNKTKCDIYANDENNRNKGEQNFTRSKKMYCCTFTPGYHDCGGKPVKATEKRQKTEKEGESSSGADKKFVFHCLTPSMASLMANYLVGNKRKNFPGQSSKQSFSDEKKLTEVTSSSLENYRNFRENRPPKNYASHLYKSSALLKDLSQKTFVEQFPVEVKYMNDIKSDESKTYGLLNARSRRRGRKIKNLNGKKAFIPKFSPNGVRPPRRPKKFSSKLIFQSGQEEISTSHTKPVTQSYSPAGRHTFRGYASSNDKDEKLRFICKNQRFKYLPDATQTLKGRLTMTDRP